MAVGATASTLSVPASALAEANGTSVPASPDGTAAGFLAESDITQAVPVTRGAPAPSLSVSDTDTLAPGARLGFGDETAMLAEDGPNSDEFFLGTGAAAPVARATTRVPPERRSVVEPEKESRGARRRRLGIPRRVTFRVL